MVMAGGLWFWGAKYLPSDTEKIELSGNRG
jgi:hypothetical protein